MSGKAHKRSHFKSGVVVKDEFKPLSEYAVDPLTWLAIAFHISDGGRKQHLWEDCCTKARERGIGEKAIVGNAGLRVMLNPPRDAWPPEAWLREFVKERYLYDAKVMVREWYGERTAPEAVH